MKKWINKNGKYSIANLKEDRSDLNSDVDFFDMYKNILKSYKNFNGSQTFFDDMPKEDLSKLNLILERDRVYVDKKGIMLYLEIDYTGACDIVSNLPEDYHIFKGRNKIVILMFGSKVLDDYFFEYNKNFVMRSAFARGISGSIIKCRITKNDRHKWDTNDSVWENDTTYWGDNEQTYNLSGRSFGSVNTNTLLNKARRVANYLENNDKIVVSRTLNLKKKNIAKIINERKLRNNTK